MYVGTENGNVDVKHVILIFLFLFQGIMVAFLSIGVIRFIIKTLFNIAVCKYRCILSPIDFFTRGRSLQDFIA